MKKVIFTLIVLISSIGVSFGYEIRIHYNGNVDTYNSDDFGGEKVVSLVGDNGTITKNGNTYTFNSNYNGTDVYYSDQNGNSWHTKFISDLYVNGNSDLSYTGNGYTMLSSKELCTNDIINYTGFEFTGSSEISGNIFTNFIDNGFAVIGSNIPQFISYGFVLLVLIILIRLVRNFKKAGKGRI